MLELLPHEHLVLPDDPRARHRRHRLRHGRVDDGEAGGGGRRGRLARKLLASHAALSVDDLMEEEKWIMKSERSELLVLDV